MMRSIVSILILWFATSVVVAAPSVIRGKAPDYAGLHIILSVYADYVSRMPQALLTIDVDTDGSFEAEADIERVTYAFMELSTYTASIYLEPGVCYDIELPPFAVRADADRFNPFYRPTPVRLVIRGEQSGLNSAIQRFDTFFSEQLSDNIHRIVRKDDWRLADRLIARCDSMAAAIGCGHPFFANHVRYCGAQLYAAARMRNGRRVLANYYVGKPVLYNVPAYWNTLQTINLSVFDDARPVAVKRDMRRELSGKNPSMERLSALLSTDTLWRDDRTLRDALIIRSISEEFYAGSMTEGCADTLLVSAASWCDARDNRMMAANIYAKKNRLRAGLQAPDFELLDEKDRSVGLQSYKGRFLYLCFMHSDNYECIKALPALDNLAQLHKADLDVLCVFTDEDADALTARLKQENHLWKGISFVADQKIVFNYGVKALPTYFLIAPDGCIAMAQAPGPTEKVGPAIAQAIRDYIIATKRGRIEIARTIYDIANANR